MHPTLNENTTNQKLKGTKNEWTKEEDLVLARGWLHVLEDSITGKSRREKDFWRRIHEYYESKNTSGITRTVAKVKGHWHYMNSLVVAFNNQYLVLKSQKLSGWSEEDFRSGTQDKYNAIYGSSFKHEHVWNLVKHEPKWVLGITTSEISRVSCDSQTPISVDDIEEIVRPTVEVEKLKVEAIKAKNKEIANLFKDPNKREDFTQEVWKKRAMEIKENYNL
ncbi:hypothetical protein Tco_0237405 [Tanacetum coccineum]